MISAIGASALNLDDGIKTVNLAPADLKKEGPSFDLPIALAMIAASGTKPFNAEDCCVVGELGLDGTVRPVISAAIANASRGARSESAGARCQPGSATGTASATARAASSAR